MAADDRGGALARWAPGLLLATLLLLTGVATYATAARLHDRERDQLTEDAQEATAAIDRRMNDYGQILRGAAGLYNASDNVTYTDFHNYFADQDVARRFPGFQAIAFASYVPRAGLPAHVRRARRDIAASGLAYPPFRPYPPLKPTDQEALVIDHLEPPPGTNRAFGFNLLSEANRRRAALLARRSGEPAATAPISLVNTPGSSLGIDLMAPVYGGPPSQTGAPREWTGVVFAAFRMDNLLRGVLGAGAGGADLEIYDVGPAATVPEGTGITRSAVAFDLRPGPGDGGARRRPHADPLARGRRPALGDRLHARGDDPVGQRARGAVGHRGRRRPREPARRGAAARAGDVAAARGPAGRVDDRRAARARGAAARVQRGAGALRLPRVARPAGAAADDHVLRRAAGEPRRRAAR